jgi:hypothetical protein
MTTTATERRIDPRHQPAFGTVCRLGRTTALVRDISPLAATRSSKT